jgi:hypothetical protein
MHTRSKLLLAALTSALLLAALVSSASANRIAASETSFRVTFSPLSFIPSFGSTVRCPVTLAGSFHSRTITKTAGSLIGYINSATVGTCETGRARVNAETLPWHIQYASFNGTLPNITGIVQNLIRPSFEIQGEIFGIRVTCRYTTPSQSGTNNRETTRGTITSLVPGSESTSSETGGCPSGRQSGSGNVTTPGGAAITATLV